MTKPIPRRNRPHTLYEQWFRTGRPYYLPILEDAKVRQLWAEYGPAVIEEFIAERPGTRPPAFWRYGTPEHKPAGWPPDEFAYLLRHGLMSADEERRARARRARDSIVN